MRYLLTLLILLLCSCSNNETLSGGVSEAGNAKVSTTIIDTNDTAIPNAKVFLVPQTYNPQTDSMERLLTVISDDKGSITFTDVPSNTYNIWAQQSNLLLFKTNIHVEKSDTITLPSLQFQKSGSIIYKITDTLLSAYTLGIPKPYTIDNNDSLIIISSIPSGKREILFMERDSSISTHHISIIAEDTTHIEKEITWRHIATPSQLSYTYNISKINRTLYASTSEGLGIFEDDSWHFIDGTNSSLQSQWIVTSTKLDNRLYLGTNKGVALLEDGIISYITEIDTQKIVTLQQDSMGGIWYQHNNEIGHIINNTVTKKYSTTDIGTSSSIQALYYRGDTLWVGTYQDGLYYKADNQWFQDTTFSKDWREISIYKISYHQDQLWLATIGHGIFCEKDNRWQNYNQVNSSISSDSIYSLCSSSEELYFGGKNGEVFIWKENQFTLQNNFTSRINKAGIFTIEAQHDTLWIGTFGSGIIKLYY